MLFRMIILVISIVRGDDKYVEISSASVVAKVVKGYLIDLDFADYCEYSLDKDKGYCTRHHTSSIKKLGPTISHRKKSYQKFKQDLM